MSANTSISWCDHTWSPWEGCTKVSPGCANCYAESINSRFRGGQNWGKGAPRRLTKDWEKPFLWNRLSERFEREHGRRTRVFPSMCDPFDDEANPRAFYQFMHTIFLTPSIDWLLLTKRPENAIPALRNAYNYGVDHVGFFGRWLDGSYPLNVWLGVSVEDQVRAEERIPLLLSIPAHIRFVSYEPALGPVDFASPMLAGMLPQNLFMVPGQKTKLPFDWLIAGGESGPGHRRAKVEWFQSAHGQCNAAGVPFFMKQDSGRFPGQQGRIPHELWKVKEFPV